VLVLIEQIAGEIWLAYAANSGHPLARIHGRSIRRITIVNPRVKFPMDNFLHFLAYEHLRARSLREKFHRYFELSFGT
jgi:hypothetical protein